MNKNIDTAHMTIEELQAKVFIPFEINTDSSHHPLFDVDPDMQYFNKITQGNINSDYFTSDSYIRKCSKKLSGDSFSMFHVNIRSLPKNLVSLENYLMLLDTKFTIIGLTETWLTDSTASLYSIDGYTSINNYRIERRGGGVSVLINDNMRYHRRKELDTFTPNFECVFIELDKADISSSKNILIGVIYRPPDTDLDTFLYHMSSVLEKIKRENKFCYLLGDYNLNLLNVETHCKTGEFIDLMFSHHFLPLINKPTRVSTNSATLIDNIFYKQC